MKTKKIEEQVEQVKDLSKNFTHSQIKEATGISSQSLINFTREGKMLGHMSFLKLSKFVGVKSIKL